MKAEAKKFDTPEDVKNAFVAACGSEQIDLSNVAKITLGGNSYGFGACEWLAE